MPGYNKHYYGYATELIYKLGHEIYDNYVEGLFVWMQDTNWPSAKEISYFISTIPPDKLIPHIKNILRIAYEEKDDFWIYGINETIRSAKLSKYFFADDEFKKILEFGDCAYNEDDNDDTYSNYLIANFESEFNTNLQMNMITGFDYQFCIEDEIKLLMHNIMLRYGAKTEEEKQKYQNQICRIREKCKERYKNKLN